MSFKFPFTNYHELNLDWILKKVETLSVNAEADANTIATYEERLQTAETQAQNAETSAANAQSAATSAASVAENALTTANSAQSSADASGALASQAATKADAAQIAADSARQAAETAQATAANFDGRITSAEQQASEALNMAQRFDEQARAAITTANNAANVATEAQATATATALELARQRTALETIGSQQTSAINSAGTAQVTAINNAGQAVLDSLPADYMNGVELVKDYTLGLYPQIETDYAPVVSFDNGADNIPVKDMKVNIIPYQSGTGNPSPSNIRPIRGHTAVNVKRTGKNLIDDSKTYQGGNSRLIIGQTDDYSNQSISLKAGTYTLNVTASQSASIYYKTETGSPVALGNTTQPRTFTVEDDCNIAIWLYISTGITAADFTSAMLNIGSTAEDYEPYTGSNISVTFPSEAGTVYGGTLDVTTGVLRVDRGIETFNGENMTAWYYSTANDKRRVFNTSLSSQVKPSSAPVANWLNGVEYSVAYPDPWTITCSSTGTLLIGVDSTISSVDDFKAKLISTNLVVCYELATPQTYQLTPIQVKTLLGENNLWADAGNTSITYRADLGLFITENSIANYTRFASMIAGVETGLTASKTYNTGDYFIVGQKLYKALTNIATGATFTLGTNCEETTVGAELVLAQ